MVKKKLERRRLEMTGVFDIETEKWTRFVAGGLLLSDGTYESFTWAREEAFVDAILAVRGTLWSHHGGIYDMLWLANHLRRRKVKSFPFLSGSRVTLIETCERKLRLRDSGALVPLRLGDAARIGGGEKSGTGLICRCRHACGGYCRIRRGMTGRLLPSLLSYLENDCRVTLAMLVQLQAFADEHDLDLAGTIGNASWLTLRRWAGLDPHLVDWSSRVHNFVRNGYMGARNEVYRPRSRAGFRYDVHAAYPAAMTLSVPVGEPSYTEDTCVAARAYSSGAPGVYKARVRVPAMTIPPLPVRSPATDEVGYPTGDVLGTWQGTELRYAESLGCEVLDVMRAATFPREEPILASFARRIVALRDEFRGQPIELFLKLFANAPSGKLAQSPEGEVIAMNAEVPRACPADDKCFSLFCDRMCCPHHCAKKCKRWNALDPSGDIFSRPTWRLADCAQPHWAGAITARQRVELHAQIVSDGQDGASVVYADNDAIFCERELTRRIGSGLGEWRPEGTFRNFHALATKMYHYDDGGRGVTRARGVSDAEKAWPLLLAGERVRDDRGVVKFKTAAARRVSLFSRQHRLIRINRVGGRYGSRLLPDWPSDAVSDEDLEHGLTVPMDYAQFLEGTKLRA